jgi:hypothetical protein
VSTCLTVSGKAKGNAPAHISAAAGPRGSGTLRLQSLSPLIAGTGLSTIPIAPLTLIVTGMRRQWHCLTAAPIGTETTGAAVSGLLDTLAGPHDDARQP